MPSPNVYTPWFHIGRGEFGLAHTYTHNIKAAESEDNGSLTLLRLDELSFQPVVGWLTRAATTTSCANISRQKRSSSGINIRFNDVNTLRC